MWGAPTAEQSAIGFEEMRKAVGEIADIRQNPPAIIIPQTGGRVIFKTLDDPDHARGFTFNGAVLDEASMLKEKAWYEVVRPTLSDTNGWMLAIATPKGMNWFWRESWLALERQDSMFWQVPTLGVEIVEDRLVRKPHPMENPFFNFEEAQQIFETVPRRFFEQEFLAQFTDDAGGVFRGVGAVAKIKHPSEPGLHQNHHFVMGADFGKAHDFTVLTLYCIECKKVMDWDRFNQIDYAFQRKRLKSLYEKWKPYLILGERNAMGLPVLEDLSREGLPIGSGEDGELGFITTAKSKPPLIESLSLGIEKGQLEIPEEYSTELQAYTFTRNEATGRKTYQAPEGCWDDRVISLALAYQAAGGSGGASTQADIQVGDHREYMIDDWY